MFIYHFDLEKKERRSGWIGSALKDLFSLPSTHVVKLGKDVCTVNPALVQGKQEASCPKQEDSGHRRVVTG